MIENKWMNKWLKKMKETTVSIYKKYIIYKMKKTWSTLIKLDS